MGNHQFAIKDFNKAIEIDPKLSDGYFRRGCSKLEIKSNHDAIKDFRENEACELEDEDKKNAGIPDGLGCCYHQLRDYYNAINYFD